MRRLKKRIRSDTHLSDARVRRPRTWDRNVYLALLIVFFGALGNYVFGDRLFLRADGLVLQNRSEIGATDLVQITEVAVRPGQRVESGQMLIRAESLNVLGRLAELSIRDAELAERGVRLRSELAMALAQRPGAEARLKQLQAQEKAISGLDKAGLVAATRRESHRNDLLNAEDRVARLTAQADGLSKEISVLDGRRGTARSALQQLKTRYSNGVHTAGLSGIVGDIVPAAGEVMNPGEAILTLYWGEPYVLAYLPQHYVFDLDVGDAVSVRAGPVTQAGRIEAILPMSQAIPDEFHTAFKLRETRQLARIELTGGHELPTRATVQITRHWRTDIDALTASWRQTFDRIRRSVQAWADPVPDRIREGVGRLAAYFET